MTVNKKIANKISQIGHTQKKQPGIQYKMNPKPRSNDRTYLGSRKLDKKVAIVTGGDSGIGKAVAIFFAKEGAKVIITYLNEHKDAKETQKQIEKLGQECLILSGDIGKEKFCQKAIELTIDNFKKINILVNNSAEQYPQDSLIDISSKQLLNTFQTNVFSYFYMIKAALPYLKKGSCIINTASVTAYRGSDHLIDYSATKGAIVALTRSLSNSLIKNGIRVNGVAPGPIWTPLIPATFSKKQVKEFGKKVPMGRPGQPEEVAPCYVFLASDDSSYMTGQILHPNGGEIING